MEEQSHYTYSVVDRDNKTYLDFSDESGTLVNEYQVEKLEKVKYDTGLEGYEMTLTKQ